MFNIDRAELKKQLKSKIEQNIPYYYGNHSTPSSVIHVNHSELENLIRRVAHEEASKIIRIALPGIIDNLVDSLYSHDEFERDIGLIPQ